jgi:hypothetical protein
MGAGDEACRSIAARQEGLITLRQARQAGMPSRRVRSRLERREWVAVLPDVYALAGSQPSFRQRLRAASLWAGEGAALSHEAAAHLWRLDGFKAPPVSVATPRNLRAPRGAGLVVHCHWQLLREDVRRAQGLEVTSVPRTLIDLAAILSPARLERTVDDALVQRLTTAEVTLERLGSMQQRGRHGLKQLRALLERRTADFAGDSALEAELLRLMRRAGLPTGIPQFDVTDSKARHVARLDFAYPCARLAVQVEGYRWHAGRRKFADDLEARNRLQDLGWRVIHVTWEDLRNRPDALVSRLSAWLRPTLFDLTS